jgi:DNA-directed RNA polymerase beta' subunit
MIVDEVERIERIFVSGTMATIVCPCCGHASTEDIAHIGHVQNILKITCKKCEEFFRSRLCWRKSVRKLVDLSGNIILPQKGSKFVRIADLSQDGLRFSYNFPGIHNSRAVQIIFSLPTTQEHVDARVQICHHDVARGEFGGKFLPQYGNLRGLKWWLQFA